MVRKYCINGTNVRTSFGTSADKRKLNFINIPLTFMPPCSAETSCVRLVVNIGQCN